MDRSHKIGATMILVFAVVMTGAMWIVWNTGPTMPEPDPSAYVPYSSAHVDMCFHDKGQPGKCLPNKMGDSRLLCERADCQGGGYKGEMSGLMYASAKDAIYSNPVSEQQQALCAATPAPEKEARN